MKKVFVTLCLALGFSTFSMAQTPETKVEKKEIAKPSRDFLTLSATYENWNQTPENVKIGGIGRGFSAHISYDFPISNSNFSFAAGIGISTSNIYFKDQILVLNENIDSLRFMDVDTATIGATGRKEDFYKKSKFNYTYVDLPLEFRYYHNKVNRNKGFKMSVGMKIGLLVGAHTKVKHALAGPVITEKVNTRRYLQSWRFAPTARIGWGNFSVFAAYHISPLFNPGEGPEVFPYSIGISISGL